MDPKAGMVEYELSPEMIRDEWRRRYAGVALEGLLAGGGAEDLRRTTAGSVMRVVNDLAIASVGLADALLAALDKPAGS